MWFDKFRSTTHGVVFDFLSDLLGTCARARATRRHAPSTEFVRLRSRERESQQRTEELRLRTGTMEAEIYQRAQEIQDVNCRPRAANEALQQEIIARQEAEEARRRTYTELAQLV